MARLSDLNQTNDSLEKALAAVAGSGRSEAFQRFVLERLKTGHAVVLLDAWDEVPVEVPEPGQPIVYKANYRQRLEERLKDFARDCPHCRVLLTSRIVGYDSSPIPDARELELFAFDWPQIEAFARAWFRDPEPFRVMLRQNPQVQGLARIPLMLTLMCLAHEEQRRHPAPLTEWSGVPTRRVQIYALCLRGLLRDWKEEKERRHISDGYVDAVLEVLAPAAYTLFAGGHEQFDESLLREEVRVALGRLGAGHELAGRNATSVIAELKHAGILITTGGHRAAPLLFLHRTFHEFLAARALARRVKSEGWLVIADQMDRKAWRPAWQEVVVLLAGQLADPLPLLRLLADKRRDDLFRHRLALAALCLTEVPADLLDSPEVDGIATEVVTRWLEHQLERTGDAVAHLTRALSAVGQTSRRGIGDTGWGMRLLTLSRDTDARLRLAAAAVLGGLGASSAPALDRLLELTRDEAWGVRLAAAAVLGGLGVSSAPVLDRFRELTRDEVWDVQRAAADALVGLAASSARALDRLLELIRDESWYVQQAAAEALVGLGASSAPALDRLRELTRDEDPRVREAAARALVGLGAWAAPALDRLLELIRDEDPGAGVGRLCAGPSALVVGPGPGSGRAPRADPGRGLVRAAGGRLCTGWSGCVRGCGPGPAPAADPGRGSGRGGGGHRCAG